MTDIPSTHFTHVGVHVEGAVLHIRLGTPETGNVVSEAMLDDLLGALALLNDLRDIRALVLSADGADFCQGGDRREFQSMLDDDPTAEGIRRCGDKGIRVCEALTGSRVVTIARLHGSVLGAGFALAIACDLRVGAEDTRFRLPEAALGLPVAWGGMLPRLLNEIGASRARELMFTGRSVRAKEAQELALLHKVTPREKLDEAVSEWTAGVTRGQATGLTVTKKLLQAHDIGTRLGAPSMLDAELMAAVVAAHHYAASASATRSDPASADAPPSNTLRRLLGRSPQ